MDESCKMAESRADAREITAKRWQKRRMRMHCTRFELVSNPGYTAVMRVWEGSILTSVLAVQVLSQNLRNGIMQCMTAGQ